MPKPRLGGKKVILTKERDIPLLHFLWRWKALSTKALCEKFFTNCKLETGYRRLLKLEQGEFIKCPVNSSTDKYVWTLDKKGFESILDNLPLLKEKGYKSEHLNHASVVAAVHLGECLSQKPGSLSFIPEQILRRVHPDVLPKFIPKGHRPYGYWRIDVEGRFKLIALEVELNLKKNADYELVDAFYRSEKVRDVLWVLPNERYLNRLYKLFMKFGNQNIAPHSFILLPDFEKLGWNVKFVKGSKKGFSINQLLHNQLTTRPEQVVTHTLLNFSKSPHNSKAYNKV